MADEKRPIDANELKREMYLISHLSGSENICIECIVDAIDDADTVDAVEVVHGRWIEFNSFMTCSECDTDWHYTDNDTDRFNYCPNCGAKMDGDGDG